MRYEKVIKKIITSYNKEPPNIRGGAFHNGCLLVYNITHQTHKSKLLLSKVATTDAANYFLPTSSCFHYYLAWAYFEIQGGGRTGPFQSLDQWKQVCL